MEQVSGTTPQYKPCFVSIPCSTDIRRKKVLRLYDRGPCLGFEPAEVAASESANRIYSFYYTSFYLNSSSVEDCQKKNLKKEDQQECPAPDSPVLSSVPFDSPSPLSPSFSLTCTLCRSASELNFLHTFADQFCGTFSSTFSESTTHVVVKTNSSSKTFKLLLGIAYRLPVITYDWVEKSMAYNELLNPVDFLFNGGARRCLTDKAVPPFCDSVFFLSESVVTLRSSAILFEACTPPLLMATSMRELLTKLLGKVGGRVERSFSKICKLDNKFKFFVFSNAKDPGDFPLDILINCHVIPVALDWISESIYCYKRCDIEPHLCPLYPTERVPSSLFY